jgi:hypothetical protein
MIAIIAGGGGEEIVIATTGAGIGETGTIVAEIVTSTGVTGIGTIATIGADLDAALVGRETAGISAGSRRCRTYWPYGQGGLDAYPTISAQSSYRDLAGLLPSRGASKRDHSLDRPIEPWRDRHKQNDRPPGFGA